mmetsp:Transcript_13428/g.41477  ORF Transcript_13428/g.41477 Transcript_13428/m.41477 type:complete len:217 (+) Transcript_13428:86-736(+)
MRPAAPSGRSFWYWRPAPLPPTKSASQSPSKRFAGSTKPSSRTPAWIVKSRTISSQPGGSSTRVSHARTGRNPRRPPCSVIHSKRGCAGSSHWGSSSSTRQQSDIVSWWYGALSLPRGKPMPALTATFRRENVLPVTMTTSPPLLQISKQSADGRADASSALAGTFTNRTTHWLSLSGAAPGSRYGRQRVGDDDESASTAAANAAAASMVRARMVR